MVLASRSNLCFRTGSLESCSGRILTATVLSSRVSFARYTSPIPPAPSGETISYGPSFVPETSGIIGRDYTPGHLAELTSLLNCAASRVRWVFLKKEELRTQVSQADAVPQLREAHRLAPRQSWRWLLCLRRSRDPGRGIAPAYTRIRRCSFPH